MINEGEAGEEGEGGIPVLPGEGTGDVLDQPGVIQVSPQDKEAIERVTLYVTSMICYFISFS